MRVIENPRFRRSVAVRASLARNFRDAVTWFVRAWSVAFPMPPLDDPNAPEPIARAAALREGAKLSENVDAISDRHVA